MERVLRESDDGIGELILATVETKTDAVLSYLRRSYQGFGQSSSS